MNKSRRIAIGGWLSNALAIMTRGWFGGVSPLTSGSIANVAFILLNERRTMRYQDTKYIIMTNNERRVIRQHDTRQAARIRDERRVMVRE